MTLSRTGLVRAATLMGTVALVAIAAADLSASQALALLAVAAVASLPLSRVCGDCASARERYYKNRRPLAGPKPGARLG